MTNSKRTVLAVMLAGLLAVTLSTVFGWAADPRLDQAHDSLVKARALIEASEDPGSRKPFGGHAEKAKAAIDKALQEIVLAKQAADKNS